MKDIFRAFVVDKQEDNFTAGVKSITMDDLPEGEVTIKVSYSSVNYKDGLASTPNGRIVSSYPFIPGIDLAGTVVASSDSRYKEGDKVLVTGYELGVSHYGGFSEYARVQADWVVPLPDGLTVKEAMAYGTAGFTAALSVKRLEDHGIIPQNGPVLVTGATGGVGSMAVSMLAKKGYEVAASTGKESEHAYLQQLGASAILSREEVSPEKIKTLDKPRWAAAVDPVGGRTLAYLLSSTKYGGAVAVSGMTGGGNVETTVFPFILRGISLFGIDSVYCPMEVRKRLWERMADDLKPEGLVESIAHEISLDDLPRTLSAILEGKVRGRVVVAID
ncbi:acryloyl-CoA reductase [Aneurinibacillus sp. Ricciae_BoGa-3]|uniref:NADPH:quinone oxidoreductase family protein n=1 Tax=Aneurinibacillus sp. Ricciae_BoGa-3 TaxID=3022697 RepID=UPI00233FEAF0|nr:acryloyl-CoA reductase [Aneurinibacillus sp. Ricciae_BoGa-3]WCK55549.1 acryloyl-CoA reductase [Aneurinibacillus sp. Ricciae_BoGa-3]